MSHEELNRKVAQFNLLESYGFLESKIINGEKMYAISRYVLDKIWALRQSIPKTDIPTMHFIEDQEVTTLLLRMFSGRVKDEMNFDQKMDHIAIIVRMNQENRYREMEK